MFEVYMFYTYVLKSLKDHKLYVGLTGDLKQRLEEHRKGRVESTKDRLPLILIYYEACLERGDAAKREKYLKTYHGKMFLRNRLKSYLTGQVSSTVTVPLK
jgi:putative endonuclease